MDRRILALVDYKSKFGSKHFDSPYRSGMDKSLLQKYFNEYNFDISFKKFHEIDIRANSYKGINIIYTSSEDIGYYYKSYIEDIVLALEECGANTIPSYKLLRANNNKVFMELIRSIILKGDSLTSSVFGSLKDLEIGIDRLEFPCVLKESEGASGTGDHLIKSANELFSKVKAISKTKNIKEDLIDYLRFIKHKGYKRESRYRKKFIVQKFIKGLQNDWKIYIFGEKYYIFYRPILAGRGIKASGGGYDNYFYGINSTPPDGIFDFSKTIYELLQSPNLSIDVAYDGSNFYLIEFQCLYFGTAGIPYSEEYFIQKEDKWIPIKVRLDIEKVYVDSIVTYINKNK